MRGRGEAAERQSDATVGVHFLSRKFSRGVEKKIL